eukprot:scaffold10972_cov127-Isochrysis_galbana.AAC.4
MAKTVTFLIATTVCGGESWKMTDDGSRLLMALAGRFRITREAPTEVGHSWNRRDVGEPATGVPPAAASARSPDSAVAPWPLAFTATSVAPNVTEPPAASISLSMRSTTEA